jgi:uncharacterized protein YlxW (UPF0749 family)
VEGIVKIIPAKTTEEILAALDAGNNGWKTPLQVDAANEIRRLQAEVAKLKARISELSWSIDDRQGGI